VQIESAQLVARTAVSIVPWPDIITTMGGPKGHFWIRAAVMPSMPGADVQQDHAVALVAQAPRSSFA
jgi:hypothetical protein